MFIFMSLMIIVNIVIVQSGNMCQKTSKYYPEKELQYHSATDCNQYLFSSFSIKALSGEFTGDDDNPGKRHDGPELHTVMDTFQGESVPC